MTSKEKAEELYNIYFKFCNELSHDKNKTLAKLMALACVDEIKQSSKLMPYTFTFEKYDDADKLTASVRAEIESFKMYWNEVKQEINKL
jgi:hypothetical protein